MEKISSNINPAVKDYIKFRNSKSERDSSGLFVIESVKLVKEALAAGISFEKVFVTQLSFEKNYEVLQRFFTDMDKQGKLVEITAGIEEKLTQTKNSQGIFAVCHKPQSTKELRSIDGSGRYIFLDKLQDTGNVGTIIRTAKALGITGIIISKNCCDIYSIKLLRSSMGAAFAANIWWSENTADDLKILSEKFSTYATVLDKSAVNLCDTAFSDGSIIVIGNEGNGLDESVVSACNHKLTIDMCSNTESLNASMAAGILMWEMMK